MENRSHAIIAITFLIVFSFTAVMVYYWLTTRRPEPRFYQIVTGQSVGDLQIKSPVTFKGIVVGHIQKVAFSDRDPAKVKVLLSVAKDAMVTQSTYAVTALKGITGGTALQLKLGQGSRATLQTSRDDPAHIPLHKSLLAKLRTSAAQDLKKINKIIGSMQALLDKNNQRHLAKTMAQLDEATSRIVTIEKHLLPVAKKMPEIARSAAQSLKQSHALLQKATELAESAKKPVNEAGEAAKSLAQLTDTSQNVINKLRRQTLPDIDRLTDSLVQTSDSIKDLSEQLESNPQSLIFGSGKPRPGPGEPGFESKDDGE